MNARCAACAIDFEQKQATQRFCSARCRQRGHRGGAASRSAPRPGLVGVTERELEQAGRLDTRLGQMAVALAEKLAAGRDTGSAMAAVSREFRSVMDEAMRGAMIETDELDELAARRDSKRAG